MPRHVVGLLLVLVAAVVDAAPFSIQVTSSPPGAEVWAAPASEPVIYKKGLTPCTITLEAANAPLTVLVRKVGCFDAYRAVGPDARALEVALAARDDPAAWARVPHLTCLGGGPGDEGVSRWGLACGTASEKELAGLTGFAHALVAWAPDASGALAIGDGWSIWLVTAGLAKRGEMRTCAELWYIPLAGTPRLLWRWISAMSYFGGAFQIDAAFAPNPVWVVHSAPVGNREHLRLHCLTTGKSAPIAEDTDASLSLPHFSPSGRLLACLRQAQSDGVPEGPGDDPPPEQAQIQLMRWDGSERHTLATGADAHTPVAFSPDESQLAYVTAQGAVAVVPVAGGQPRTVLYEPAWSVAAERIWAGSSGLPAGPMWAPDGSRVAVNSGPAPDDGGTMGAGTTVERVLWATVASGERGFLRGCAALGWHAPDCLLVTADGYDAQSGIGYKRLLLVGVDGKAGKVVAEPDATRLRLARGQPRFPPPTLSVADVADRLGPTPAPEGGAR